MSKKLFSILVLVLLVYPLSAATFLNPISFEYLITFDEEDEEVTEELIEDEEELEEVEDEEERLDDKRYEEDRGALRKRDIVLQKRTKDVQGYKEPDLAKVIQATYMYESSSFKSRKYFELYKGDEMEVLKEDGEWLYVVFLDKRGWIPSEDVVLDRYHSYRLVLDFSSGFSYSPNINRYSVLMHHNISSYYKVLKNTYAGGELRLLSIDQDVSLWGGLCARTYLPFLSTKKSRTTASFGIGYMQMKTLVAGRDVPMSDLSNASITLRGVYVSVDVDWIYRLFDKFYFGIGMNYTYANGKGSIVGESSSSGEIDLSMHIPGVHFKFLYNTFK